MQIEDLPGNSRTRRPPMEVPTPEPVNEEKKVDLEQIATSPVRRRKPSLGKRFKELFVRGDAQSVGGYILFDILIPAAKDMIADAVSQGTDKMLFGEARSSRRFGSRPSTQTNPTHVSYNKFSTPSWKREEPRPTMSRQARANHDFNEIVLATRREAEEVIRRLYFLIEKYEQATVADLYELVGETGDFTDHKWGWTDLQGAQVRRDRDGYLLDLPTPEPI